MSNEIYKGIKFNYINVNHIIPTDIRLEALIYWAYIFHLSNLAPATKSISAGNLSFRNKTGSNEFFISGTQVGLNSKLTKRQFVLINNVDFEKKIVNCSGVCKPSSETMLHAAIYQNRSDVHAVFHGHCTEILNNAQKLNVMVTNRVSQYGSIDLVNSVLEILDHQNFIVIKEHGFLAMSADIASTGNLCLEMLKKSLNVE